MDSFVDLKARCNLEYATQYLGFTPDSFIDTITLYATEIVEQETQKLKLKTAELFPSDTSKSEFSQAFDLLQIQHLEAVEMVFEKYGKYLKNNLLCIPQHVLLPEDKVHRGPKFLGSDLESKIENINDLCKEIRCVKYANAVLKAKVENLESILTRQEKLLQDHELLLDVKNEMMSLLEDEICSMGETVRSLETLTGKINPTDSTHPLNLSSDSRKELLVQMEIVSKHMKPQKLQDDI